MRVPRDLDRAETRVGDDAVNPAVTSQERLHLRTFGRFSETPAINLRNLLNRFAWLINLSVVDLSRKSGSGEKK